VITSSEASKPVSFTEFSRQTGHYLHEAMLRGPVLVKDRHGEIVLEIRRIQPTAEVTV
jgi:hypothetical protein